MKQPSNARPEQAEGIAIANQDSSAEIDFDVIHQEFMAYLNSREDATTKDAKAALAHWLIKRRENPQLFTPAQRAAGQRKNKENRTGIYAPGMKARGQRNYGSTRTQESILREGDRDCASEWLSVRSSSS